MASINKVILLGNLGADPEMRYTAGGDPVASISIATSSSWNDKQSGEKREKTEWHRVVFFRRLAEVVGEYMKKGSSIYVEGQLQTNSYEDKNTGERKFSTQLLLEKCRCLDLETMLMGYKSLLKKCSRKRPQLSMMKFHFKSIS